MTPTMDVYTLQAVETHLRKAIDLLIKEGLTKAAVVVQEYTIRLIEKECTIKQLD